MILLSWAVLYEMAFDREQEQQMTYMVGSWELREPELKQYNPSIKGIHEWMELKKKRYERILRRNKLRQERALRIKELDKPFRFRGAL